MKPSRFTLPLIASLAFAPLLHAQNEAVTDPVGFVSIDVPAQSDAVLAVPLNRAPAFRGIIQSISGNVVTVSGTPNWTANQFVQNIGTQNDTFAVVIASGTKEGLIGRVTANGTGTLTVQLDTGEDLTGIGTVAVPVDPDGAGPKTAQADQIDVTPYWTPSSLITGVPSGTEMYIFDNTTTGQNVSPSTLLQFFEGFGWFETIGFTDQSHRRIGFGTGFILRNKTSNPVPVSFVGSVPMSKHRLVLRTLASNTTQDQSIGYLSPVPEPLNQLNLGAQNTDELYLFDNSATGMNKSPSLLLVYFDGRWYNSVSFADVTDTTTLQPGNGMIYRKVGTASPQAFVWQDLQSYLSP